MKRESARRRVLNILAWCVTFHCWMSRKWTVIEVPAYFVRFPSRRVRSLGLAPAVELPVYESWSLRQKEATVRKRCWMGRKTSGGRGWLPWRPHEKRMSIKPCHTEPPPPLKKTTWNERVIKGKMEEKFLPLFESHRDPSPLLSAPRRAVVSPFLISGVSSRNYTKHSPGPQQARPRVQHVRMRLSIVM